MVQYSISLHLYMHKRHLVFTHPHSPADFSVELFVTGCGCAGLPTHSEVVISRGVTLQVQATQQVVVSSSKQLQSGKEMGTFQSFSDSLGWIVLMHA